MPDPPSSPPPTPPPPSSRFSTWGSGPDSPTANRDNGDGSSFAGPSNSGTNGRRRSTEQTQVNGVRRDGHDLTNLPNGDYSSAASAVRSERRRSRPLHPLERDPQGEYIASDRRVPRRRPVRPRRPSREDSLRSPPTPLYPPDATGNHELPDCRDADITPGGFFSMSKEERKLGSGRREKIYGRRVEAAGW